MQSQTERGCLKKACCDGTSEEPRGEARRVQGICRRHIARLQGDCGASNNVLREPEGDLDLAARKKRGTGSVGGQRSKTRRSGNFGANFLFTESVSKLSTCGNLRWPGRVFQSEGSVKGVGRAGCVTDRKVCVIRGGAESGANRVSNSDARPLPYSIRKMKAGRWDEKQRSVKVWQ